MTAHPFGRDAETAEDGPNLAMMGGEQGAKRQKLTLRGVVLDDSLLTDYVEATEESFHILKHTVQLVHTHNSVMLSCITRAVTHRFVNTSLRGTREL